MAILFGNAGPRLVSCGGDFAGLLVPAKKGVGQRWRELCARGRGVLGLPGPGTDARCGLPGERLIEPESGCTPSLITSFVRCS